jgi:hypothetical protein
MGKPIRVPDPVYSAAEREAERRDVTLGAVVEGWKDKAEMFEEMEARHR